MSKFSLRIGAVVFTLAVFAANPALAKQGERRFTISSFNEIAVEGDVTVDLITGKSPSARATGANSDLDRVKIEPAGDKLKIWLTRPIAGGGFANDTGPVTVYLTGYELDKVGLRGGGKVSVSFLKGDMTQVNLQGAGTIQLGKVETSKLTVSVVGNGQVVVAGGRADSAKIELNGAGSFEAPELMVDEAKLYQLGPASSQLGVKRSVEIFNNGAGSIAITGKGQCLVRAAGSGDISCPR